MQIIINGKNIDYKNNYAKIIYDAIFSFSLKHKYQSFDSISENICSLLELFYIACENEQEYANKEDKKELLKMKLRINIFFKNHRNIDTKDKILAKEKLMIKIYDFLLSVDGLSNLHGFRTK